MGMNPFLMQQRALGRRPEKRFEPMHPLEREFRSKPEYTVREGDPVEEYRLREEEAKTALPRGSLKELVEEDEQKAKARFYVVRQRRLQALAPRLVNAVLTAKGFRELLTRRKQQGFFNSYEKIASALVASQRPGGLDRRVVIRKSPRQIVMTPGAFATAQAMDGFRRLLLKHGT